MPGSPAGFDFSECDEEYQQNVDALEQWARAQNPFDEDDARVYRERWQEITDDYERCTNDKVHGQYETNAEFDRLEQAKE